MNSSISGYYHSFKNKKVAFLGIGVTNKPLIIKFAKAGANVIACDKQSVESLGKTAEELKALGVTLKTGENYLENIDADVVFRSPGINFNSPQLVEMRKRGIEITSEMEEFFKLCPCKIYAVTGSDGKTTTTTVISKFLEAQGKRVFLGGNIGTPLLPIVEEMNDDDCAVVELSSFQLISMKMGPDVAVVTNVAPNHLDVHKNMNEYIEAKKNILLYQNKQSRTVLNQMNKITAGFSKEVKGDILSFSRTERPKKGAFCDCDGNISFIENGNEQFIMKSEDIRIPGLHNVENYLAAICAVWGDVSIENIKKVAKEFGGVEHRIEFVREINGVKWYNDSIASSPTRTVAGLRSFEQKLIIIAGGYDKKIPFEPFAEEAIKRVKILILCGHTAQKIEDCVKSQPDYEKSGIQIFRVSDLAEAVKKADEVAQNGDIVSLSPACASFDQFNNFAERGNHFKWLVSMLHQFGNKTLKRVPEKCIEQHLIYKDTETMTDELLFLPPHKKIYEKAPVFFLVPGGGWSRNSSEAMYCMSMSAAESLREKGFAVASITYRGINPDKVLMPEIVSDVFDAMGYLSHYSDILEIDSNKIFSMGHSAGAHLVLQTAYMNRDDISELCYYHDNFKVCGVIGLASPTYYSEHISPYPDDINDLVLFEKENYETFTKYSPLWQATKQSPPTLLVHGDKDNLVYPYNSDFLYQRLKFLNVPTEFIISHNGEHSFLPYKKGVNVDYTLDKIMIEVEKFILSLI